MEHTAALPNVRLLNRIQVIGYTQEEHSVRVQARDLDSGATRTLATTYLVGCDGGRSFVRK